MCALALAAAGSSWASAATIGGQVYDSATGAPVRGVSLRLFYDAEDTQPGLEVPPEELGAGQQSQVTAADGRYQFDVPEGRKYRLELSVHASSYAFPSSRIPARPGLASDDGDGQIVEAETPAAPELQGADRSYYLRFDVARASDGFRNNHVPVDPLAAVVTLEKRADRSEASTGDIVLYTLTVTNRSNRDLTAAQGRSLYVEDAPERGLSYLAGRAVARIGGATLSGFEPPRAAGARLIRFGPFDLAAGQTLTLRYHVSVGIDTRPGEYRNRAVALDAGGVELSEATTATVRVVADSVLENGAVVGRVFCDQNGNQKLDAGEQGLMGARVYADTGSYAVSDSQGFYHLSRVRPGTHLVKIDTATLGGGALVSRGSELLRLSSGLSAKASFAVRCNAVEVRAEAGAAGEASAAAPSDAGPTAGGGRARVHLVRGDVHAMTAQLDGVQLELPEATIVLTAPDAVRRAAPEGAVNLEPIPEGGYGRLRPTWRTRWSFPRGLRPSKWSLVIFRVRGDGGTSPVRVIEGAGSPPAEISWDGLLDDGTQTPGGSLYAAQLHLTGAPGAVEAASAANVFGIGYGTVSAGTERKVLRGDFFAGTARKPTATPALKQEVAALAKTLGPDDTLEIESHFDGTGDRLATIARTQREAMLVADLLAGAGVSQDRVEARGRGSLEPLEPGASAAARRANRRLVVVIARAAGPASAQSIPDHVAGTARAQIDGEPVALDEDGRFEKRLAEPGLDSVLIGLEAADGRRVVIEVGLDRPRAPSPAAAPSTRPGPVTAGGAPDKTRARVHCDLAEARCWVDGRPLPSAPMRVSVTLPSAEVTTTRVGGALRLPAPLEFALSAPLPPGETVAEWSLTIREQSGAVVHEMSSERSGLPVALRWDGTSKGVFVLRPGEVYTYRLAVTFSGGGSGLSPERSFALDGSKPSAPAAAAVSLTGRLFTKHGELSAQLKNELSKFAQRITSRPGDERYRIDAKVSVTGESATERHLALAGRKSRLQRYLRRLGVGERVQLSTELGDEDAISIAAAEPAAAAPPVPASAQTPARVVINGVDRELGGQEFDADVGLGPDQREIVLDVTAPTGHRAVYTIDLSGAAAPSAGGDENAGGSGVAAASGERGREPGAQARGAGLSARLPQKGTLLRSRELAVSGRTDPSNRVFAGVDRLQEVRVGRDGRYAGTIELPAGKSELRIQAVDPKGHRASIRWPVEVSDRELFVLGLAEGIASSAYTSRGWLSDFAYLDGMNEETTVGVGPVLLHGRATAYLKARLSDWHGFDQIRVTGHLDTARSSGTGAFFEEVVDPTASAGGDFLTYGDSAEEVRDANTRGKLYLRIEADRSKAVVGSVHTAVRGGDLFRYDRTLSGALLDVDRKVAAHRLQVKSFVSGDTGELSRDVNWYRSTGGSLYYLRHGRVVEGSERVRVVIRDRDLGTVVSERVLQRNRDYTVDYSSGRILLTQPIGSTAASPWIVDNFDSSVTPLGGNPVYLEARYEHQDPDADGGRATGLALRDSVGRIEVGAGVVSESRDSDSDYTLWGADLGVELGKRSHLRAEVAGSRARDAANFISQDGGISFLDFDHIARTSDVDGGISGIFETNSLGARAWQLGWKLSGDIHFGDFASRSGDERADGEAPTREEPSRPDATEDSWMRRVLGRTQLSFILQSLDRGFASGGTLPEQGRFKMGAQITHRINATDRVLFRHAAEVASLPRVGPTQADVDAAVDALAMEERATYLSSLQWARDDGRWHYRVEGAFHRLSSTAALADGSTALDAQRLGGGGRVAFDYSKRLTLRAGQQFVAGLGDRDPFLEPIDADDSSVTNGEPLAGVATNVGADVRLTEDLAVGTDWYQRWNGDNAAQVGLSSALSSAGSMYVRERVATLDGGTVSTTAVGAEERFGESGGGRRYGEYQIENGVLGQRNRAVLGLGHRWDVGRGLRIGAGIEHQQIFGGALPDGTPVGNAQRNVLHGSAEYTFHDRLKTSASVELRFDDGLDTGLADLVSRDPRPVGGAGDYPDHGGVAPGAPVALAPVDRIQIVAGAGAGWKATENHTILGRVRLSHTGVRGETGVRATAARHGEATGGFAYRPVAHDWLHLLSRYSYLRDMRPVAAGEPQTEERSHVFAVIPLADLPWRLTLAGKIAFKRTQATTEVPGAAPLVSDTNTVLALARLGYRFFGRWDASGELRMLVVDNPNGAETLSGTLAEAGYRLSEWVRLGIGYNLSRFSDNELGDLQRDSHGFFVRLTGQY